MAGIASVAALIIQFKFTDKRTNKHRFWRKVCLSTVPLSIIAGIIAGHSQHRASVLFEGRMDSLRTESRDSIKVLTHNIVSLQDSIVVIKQMTVRIDSLLRPFALFSVKRFPKLDTGEALVRLGKEIQIFNTSVNIINTSTNRGIVTQNQSGGNNTIVNQSVNAPLEISLIKLEIKNKPVAKILHGDPLNPDTMNLPVTVQNHVVYHNKLLIQYRARIAYNAVGIAFNRSDIIFGEINYPPSKELQMMYKASHREGNRYYVFIGQPQNMRYVIDVYSLTPIENIKDIITIETP